MGFKVYSSEGVSFPFGKFFPPAGFSHTLIFDPYSRHARTLSGLECWLPIGGTIAQYPGTDFPREQYGQLPPQSNHPELLFYTLSIIEGLLNYSAVNYPNVRCGNSFPPPTSLLILGNNKGKGGKKGGNLVWGIWPEPPVARQFREPSYFCVVAARKDRASRLTLSGLALLKIWCVFMNRSES